jgi:hypothetical protein
MPTPRIRIATALAGVALLASCTDTGGSSVTLTAPEDGATVGGSVALTMSADGIAIEPAGEVRDDSGHFHVIADAGCVPAGEVVPKDADHLHFGQGQIEGTIALEPGRHDLCLQVADGAHEAMDVTDTVSITVGITSREDWCSTIDRVDDLYADSDALGLPFADQQVLHESIRRLVAQLDDGIDQVDADVRTDVASTLDFASRLSTALAGASTPEDAEPELERIFAEFPDEQLPAADWILDNCDVDIDD